MLLIVVHRGIAESYYGVTAMWFYAFPLIQTEK